MNHSSAAKSRAVARPMPDAAPVTKMALRAVSVDMLTSLAEQAVDVARHRAVKDHKGQAGPRPPRASRPGVLHSPAMASWISKE
jgi:hypothetical protein